MFPEKASTQEPIMSYWGPDVEAHRKKIRDGENKYHTSSDIPSGQFNFGSGGGWFSV